MRVPHPNDLSLPQGILDLPKGAYYEGNPNLIGAHRPPGPRPYNGILAEAEKALVSFVNQLAMFEGVNPLHTT